MNTFYMHQYTFRKVVWRIVHFTYNSFPPTNVKNMLENWLNGIHKMTKARIRIRVSAFCWSLWKYRNNIIFNRTVASNFLQVILRLCTGSIHGLFCSRSLGGPDGGT
jgi:hypothetical protein